MESAYSTVGAAAREGQVLVDQAVELLRPPRRARCGSSPRSAASSAGERLLELAALLLAEPLLVRFTSAPGLLRA